MGYVVSSPLVIAADDSGRQHYFYDGMPLPASITQDELDRLAADGMITEVADVEPPEEVPADGAPKGNASRDEWAAYAKSQGAPDEETKDGGLSQTELRAKYGK